MSISDVLTIIGLLIAVIAILSENKREYVLFRLSYWHYILFGVGFLIINYLIFYEWFIDRIAFLYLFENENFPFPETWAYITTITLLGVFIITVIKGRFVKSKFKKLIDFYKKCILNENFDLLIELIEKNHKSDIVEYLNKRSQIKESKELFVFEESEFDKQYNQIIKKNRLHLAAMVYGNIILDKALIEKIANKAPYFFTNFISELSSRENADEDFVDSYLTTLLKSKNYYLLKEILNNNNNSNSIRLIIEPEHKILKALLSKIRVAEYNKIYNSFGLFATREIALNRNSESFFMMSVNGYNNEKNKHSGVNLCIKTFNIMIREAMFQYDKLIKTAVEEKKEKPEILHLHLFYYRHIIADILKNLDFIKPNFDTEDDEPSYYHKYIYQIIGNQTDWIEDANKHQIIVLIIDIRKCLSDCLHLIAKTKYLSDKFKIKCFDNVLKTYFEIAQLANANEFIVNEFNRIFTDEPYLNRKLSEKDNVDFIFCLRETWLNFDKVPYIGLSVYDEFREKYLIPIGIAEQ